MPLEILNEICKLMMFKFDGKTILARSIEEAKELFNTNSDEIYIAKWSYQLTLADLDLETINRIVKEYQDKL